MPASMTGFGRSENAAEKWAHSFEVKSGKKAPDTALNVTVIDPNSAVNRGYSGALEALMHNPSVYRGR